MHIVFICNEMPPAPYGGIGAFVNTMSQSLAAKGHRVTIVGTYWKDFGWEIPGVQVIPILRIVPRFCGNLLRFANYQYFRRLAIYRVLRALHKKQPIDIVEWPDCEGLFFRAIAGVTDILRTHGANFSHAVFDVGPHDALGRANEVNTLRKIPNWIGVSTWFSKFLQEQANTAPKKSATIYNSIDIQLFKPSNTFIDSQKVFYSGSLIKRKGVFQLVKAANIFLQTNKQAELIILGRDLQDELRHLEEIIDPNVRDQIKIVHPVDQAYLAHLMRQSAVFCMPSILESFGNVWGEAMASGIPVVGSKATCGPEIVPDGDAGILVDPDNPQEIAEAVLELLGNSELRKQMGQAGRQVAVERYSLTKTVDQTLQFYTQCLKASL